MEGFPVVFAINVDSSLCVVSVARLDVDSKAKVDAEEELELGSATGVD